MNRRLVALKMLVLAAEELIFRGELIYPDSLKGLALQYGKGINIEEWELEPFLNRPIIEALYERETGSCTSNTG
jgi:hypothetical protein